MKHFPSSWVSSDALHLLPHRSAGFGMVGHMSNTLPLGSIGRIVSILSQFGTLSVRQVYSVYTDCRECPMIGPSHQCQLCWGCCQGEATTDTSRARSGSRPPGVLACLCAHSYPDMEDSNAAQRAVHALHGIDGRSEGVQCFRANMHCLPNKDQVVHACLWLITTSCVAALCVFTWLCARQVSATVQVADRHRFGRRIVSRYVPSSQTVMALVRLSPVHP
eukprot:1753175-Amphidinium_carterae.1